MRTSWHIQRSHYYHSHEMIFYTLGYPAGLQRLQQQLPEVLEDGDNTITFTLRRLLSLLREDMQMLTERIDVLDKELAELSSQQVAYHH